MDNFHVMVALVLACVKNENQEGVGLIIERNKKKRRGDEYNARKKKKKSKGRAISKWRRNNNAGLCVKFLMDKVFCKKRAV